MENFYEKFNLESNLKIEDINHNLQEQHSMLLRRLNNTVGNADREYRARKDLELIEEALEIFKDNESKNKYDLELINFENQNKVSGHLLSESIEDENSQDEKEDYNNNLNKEDLDEYKKIQEMLQKKTVEEVFNKINDQPKGNNNNKDKAMNFIVRAEQSLNTNKLDLAKDFIDKALDENAQLFEAWDIMFFYYLQKYKLEQSSDSLDLTYRFPAFYDSNELKALNKKDINKSFEIGDTFDKLRDFMSTKEYKLSEMPRLKDIKHETKALRDRLENKELENMFNLINNHYKTLGNSQNLEFYYSNAYMYEDARIAFDNALRYGTNKQQIDFKKRVIDTLREFYKNDLEKNHAFYRSKVVETTNSIISNLKQFDVAADTMLSKHSPGKKTRNKTIGIILFVISIFFAGQIFSCLEVSFFHNVYRSYIYPIISFNSTAKKIVNFYYYSYLLTFVTAYPILFFSTYFDTKYNNGILSIVQFSLTLVTLLSHSIVLILFILEGVIWAPLFNLFLLIPMTIYLFELKPTKLNYIENTSRVLGLNYTGFFDF